MSQSEGCELKVPIPAVAIAALILSLVAIFPAFGAARGGGVGFIDPSAIHEDNDGSLTVATPDAQAWGRQGGQIGLYLDDEDSSVPVRRVLIPELDGEWAGTRTFDAANTPPITLYPDGKASVTAHSAEIKVKAGSLKAGDYVMVGDHAVRRVVSVATPTALPVSISDLSADGAVSEWYVWVPTDATDVAAALESTVAALPKLVFTEFDDGETVNIDLSPTPTIPAEFLHLEYGAEDATVAFSDINTDIPADSATNKATLRAGVDENITITIADIQDDTDYTVTINAEGFIGNTQASRDYTLTLHMLHRKDTVTLDKPFAVSSVDDATTANTDESLLDVYKITIGDDVLEHDDIDWANNYHLYAKAIRLTGDNSQIVGVSRRYRADYVVAPSNISTTSGGVARIPSPTTGANEGDALHRLTGNQGSGRVRNDDAMIVQVDDELDSNNDLTGGYVVSNLYSAEDIQDIDEEDVIFLGADPTDTEFMHYLAAWFVGPNDVAVTVRSQAHRTPTSLAMPETYGGSGKFALKIKAVASGTPDTSKTIPEIPVKTRDVLTLSAGDLTATLPIETFPPSFTDLSPARDSRTMDSRPEISAQVRDGDSGLAEKDVHILFMIEQASGTTYKTLTPDRDGDVDEMEGGFSVRGRLRGADAPSTDATISWWIKATDKIGNVGYSDRVVRKDDKDDACAAKTDADGNDLTGKALIEALAADDACDSYVVHVDNTDPKLERAETGRHWDPSLLTGDSDDKTEYRVGKAEKNSVLAVFSESLDAKSVSASDFEVNGATPVDAVVYNVKVRQDDDGKDNYDGDSKLHDGSTLDAGLERGYVFLALASDMKPSATPKVALVDAVLDLAGNELDSAAVNAATDRIAPTLTVSIVEGSRPATRDKVNLKITSDENVGTPTATFYEITSKTVDGETTQTVGAGVKGTVKYVSATEYAAVVSASGANDGLYTIRVEATDSAGGNKGTAGDIDDVDVDDDTKAILFEKDGNIGDLDVNPDKDGAQDKFETDDRNAYVFIDFSAEANEYDRQKDGDGKRVGDDLDTHHGVAIVSATLNGADISDALLANADGNIFLYKAPDGLAVGDHALEVVAEDAAGNRHPSARKATIAIAERKPFSLKLNPGWNLVSIPGEPEDSDINVVIPAERTDIASVLTYDPTVSSKWLSARRGADGAFTGTLKDISSSRAYWVETDSFMALPVNIPKQSPGSPGVLPTIEIAAGWNLVPILDMDGDFLLDDDDKLPVETYFAGLEGLRAYTFNAIVNRWERAMEVQIGKGYWVYADSAGVIVP